MLPHTPATHSRKQRFSSTMDMLGCVGVDVGGTNTDAVVLCGRRVVAAVKEPTTGDVISGVRRALRELLTRVKNTDPDLRIVQVNIGTTHFVNAVVQRKSLVRVSVIRLCGQASRALPPFEDFPRDLESVIKGEIYMIDGGFQFNGQEIASVIEDEVRACARDSLDKGVRNFVVVGIFSPVDPSQEEKVRDLLLSEFPDVSVTLSNNVGQLGMVERENAAILNESLKPLCQKTVQGFRTALDDLGLSCPFYLTQNDGTIINSLEAARYPVTTFASGPTNSMRGAAFLLDVEDCIVVDIGGTTADFGALVKGFPRQASAHVKVGGVLTNFRMPDVLSVGVGGGSIVSLSGTGSNKTISVGPLSTGYRLTTEGLAFGGDTFTTTDAAILTGMIELGDKEKVKERVSLQDAQATIGKIRDIIEDYVDQMKTSKSDVTVALVGGGSVLVDKENTKMSGVSRLIKPQHFDVANAIGAALSQISGTVEYVASLTDLIGEQRFKSAVESAENNPGPEGATAAVEREKGRLFSEAKKLLREDAVGKAEKIAVGFGANPTSLEVVEVSDISLAYLPGNACRVKVKVVGDLASEVLSESATPVGSLDLPTSNFGVSEGEQGDHRNQMTTCTGQRLDTQSDPTHMTFDPLAYEPDVNPTTGEWTISEYDVECICVGAGILGCGGGGSPYLGKIMTQRKLRQGKTIRVISTERYAANANADEELAVAVAFMGAPVVLAEKVEGGDETRIALEAFGALLNLQDSAQFLESEGCKVTHSDRLTTCDFLPTNLSPPVGPKEEKRKRITAIFPAEIGGLNSVEPFLLAAETGLPVLDCDEMGRAYPELQMTTNCIYKEKPYPAVTADDNGRRAAVLFAKSHKDVEDYFRDVCTDMGCQCALIMSELEPQKVGSKTVKRSLSRAWHLGRAVLLSRATNTCPLTAILRQENGRVAITGKIVEVNRETRGGFNRGEMRIVGLGEDSSRSVRIDFQNENLIVRELGTPQACTPDLITCVDTETGEAITTEHVRYGLRVSVVVIPSCPEMATPEALRVVGPSAFGYDDVTYTPVVEYVQPEPVPL